MLTPFVGGGQVSCCPAGSTVTLFCCLLRSFTRYPAVSSETFSVVADGVWGQAIKLSDKCLLHSRHPMHFEGACSSLYVRRGGRLIVVQGQLLLQGVTQTPPLNTPSYPEAGCMFGASAPSAGPLCQVETRASRGIVPLGMPGYLRTWWRCYFPSTIYVGLYSFTWILAMPTEAGSHCASGLIHFHLEAGREDWKGGRKENGNNGRLKKKH